MEIPGSLRTLPQDRRARQGVWLLLASLGVFFFSSLLLYVVYIYMRLNNQVDPAVPFRLPRSFIGSTLLLVGISLALHWATHVAKRDQFQLLIVLIGSALLMAILFMVVQTEGMAWMVMQVQQGMQARASAYALTLCLAVIHALHVVGGLVGLVWVQVNAVRRKYDHERNFGVVFCALYWHFLDAVWVVLLAGFMIASALINARGE